jgi:hypothetical protein
MPYKTASHGKSEQSTHEQSPHGDTASEQWMAMESSHSDTMSVQRIVRILVLTSDRVKVELHSTV